MTREQVITLEDHYTTAAWANGEKSLQAGRWPHINLMLDATEPGVKAEVMARLAKLRREQAMKETK
ncbi:MAG: hypothetical protein WC829_15345 [Hyphomicrobium sp.]|jgi:hypothetical protein